MIGSVGGSKQGVRFPGHLTIRWLVSDLQVDAKTLASATRTVVFAALAVVAFGLAVWGVRSVPTGDSATLLEGPFWTIYPAWIGVVILACIALMVENRVVRAMSVLLFGLTVIGLLGYLEPFGVFHDSWRNVGLGQLSLDPRYAAQALSNAYVAGSPTGFVALGLIRQLTPDTATLLQLYPLLTVLVYCPGIYCMSLAFVDAHFPGYASASRTAPHRVRFGVLSVFAFLTIASIFSVRVNPAPQSVAFAIMPFFLAAMLRSRQKVSYRLWALVLFGLIVLTHPITSLMAALICGAFFASDFLVRSARQRIPVVTSNTVILYATLFISWLIYIGVWVVKVGGNFAARMLSVLSSGQTAVVSQNGGYISLDFVWAHRVAMLLAGVLVMLGLVISWKASRAAATRLLLWFVVCAIWLPFMLLGEFGDRGPLFLSLPACLSIAFLLNMQMMGSSTRTYPFRATAAKVLIMASMVAMSITAFATSYTTHIGEIVTSQEVEAFDAITHKLPDTRIFYGYMPPLTGSNLPLYYTTNQLSTYAMGAADFSYEKILHYQGVIVVSDNMRQAAKLRGTKSLADYDAFLARLQDTAHYELIYSNGFVKAYNVR